MKLCSQEFRLFSGAFVLAALLTLSPRQASAQWPALTTPDAQRNALNAFRSAFDFLQDATRSAPSYGPQGAGNLWGNFDSVRGSYNALKQTLTPDQLAKGANALAELDAGLDIIQEAFANYENDLAAGRAMHAALRDLCEVL